MIMRPQFGQHMWGRYYEKFPSITKDAEKMNPRQDNGKLFRFSFMNSNRDKDTLAANLEYQRKARSIRTTARNICPVPEAYVLIGSELYMIQSVLVDVVNQLRTKAESYTIQLIQVDNPLGVKV